MDTFYALILSALTDWLSIIVELVCGVGVALVLAYVVPRKLNNERSLKDYYMLEMQSIKAELNEFCKSICLGKLPANRIKETFKQLSIKLSNIQDSVASNLKCDIAVSSQLHELQRYVTMRDEINNQYQEDNVSFNEETIKEVSKLQEHFNKNMLSAIAAINGASSKKNAF